LNLKDNIYEYIVKIACLINVYVTEMFIRYELYVLQLQELQIPSHFNMHLVINICLTVIILPNVTRYFLH